MRITQRKERMKVRIDKNGVIRVVGTGRPIGVTHENAMEMLELGLKAGGVTGKNKSPKGIVKMDRLTYDRS